MFLYVFQLNQFCLISLFIQLCFYAMWCFRDIPTGKVFRRNSKAQEKNTCKPSHERKIGFVSCRSKKYEINKTKIDRLHIPFCDRNRINPSITRRKKKWFKKTYVMLLRSLLKELVNLAYFYLIAHNST